jgi:hypothetical protein
MDELDDWHNLKKLSLLGCLQPLPFNTADHDIGALKLLL